MITLRHLPSPSPGELPFLLCDRGETIAPAQAFLHELLLKGMSRATLRAYSYDLLAFYRFLISARIGIDGLSRDRALDFIAAMRNAHTAPRTINRRITVIRSFLNAHEQGLGDRLFAAQRPAFYKGRRNGALLGPSRIKAPSPQTLRVKVPSTIRLPLESDAVRSFIAKLKTWRDRAIVSLMLCSGLRSSEIIDLQTHGIDLAASQILVWGKGAKERILPISPSTRNLLANYLAFERPGIAHTTCFVVLKGKRRGQYMTPEGLRKIFRHRRKPVSLKDAHPHRFRHTFCTNLIRQRVPLPVVQKLMGHASIDTTLIYINLSMEDVAAEYHRAMNELARIDAGE